MHARIDGGPVLGVACARRVTGVTAADERRARAEAIVRPLLPLQHRGRPITPEAITRELLGRPFAVGADESAIVTAAHVLCGQRRVKHNPFASEAQRRAFHAKAARGEISHAVVAQWERETVGPLPARLHPPSVLIAPRSVRAQLRRGVELADAGFGGRGLKPETVSWARKLADAKPIDLAKAHDMHGWLARHGAAEDEAAARLRDDHSPAAVAWLLWGGDPAIPYSAGRRSRDPVFQWNAAVLKHFREAKRNGRRRSTPDEATLDLFAARVASPAPAPPIAAHAAPAPTAEVSDANPRFDVDLATNALLDELFRMDFPLVVGAVNDWRDNVRWIANVRRDLLGGVARKAPARYVPGSSIQGEELTRYALDTASYALRWMVSTGRLSTESRRELDNMSFPAFARMTATVAATSPSLAVGPLGEVWEATLRRWSATKPRYTLQELLKLPRRKERDDRGRSVLVMLAGGDRVHLKRTTSSNDVREIIGRIAEDVAHWHYGYPFAMR